MAFHPNTSYLASGVTAAGTDCPTALAVASASRPHTFDPPPAKAPVPGFAADGFTCVGQHEPGSALAVDEYRCTRGPEVVSFQRSS